MRLSRIDQHIKDEPCENQRALLGVSSSRSSSVSRGVRSAFPIWISIPLVPWYRPMAPWLSGGYHPADGGAGLLGGGAARALRGRQRQHARREQGRARFESRQVARMRQFHPDATVSPGFGSFTRVGCAKTWTPTRAGARTCRGRPLSAPSGGG
jgi:hypothetical protein